MAEQIRSWVEARSRYRLVVYSLGIISLLAIVFVFGYQAILTHRKETLVSAAFDGPFFETSKLVLGAVFGGALVGIIFDGFQSKVINAENNFVSTMVKEGIVDVFANDRDPRFIEWLSVNIAGAKSEISIVGLGMGFLVHNRDLIVAIAEQVKKQKNLRVSFYIGASSSIGVANRAEEEAAWHKRHGLAYDPSWIDRYAPEIFTTIKQALTATHLRRVKFMLTKTQPTLCIVRIDDRTVYYPYGPPSIRGSQSPWTQIDLNANKGHLSKFIGDALEFYTDKDNADEFKF